VGSVNPVTENPAPVTLACEIVTLAVLAVTVTVLDELLPTFTLPKLSEVGLAASVPAAAAPPVPINWTVLVGFDALLVSVTLPLTAPAVVGANVAENEADCPGASVSGSCNPVAVKPVPLVVIPEIVRFALPLLFKLTVRVVLVPVACVPKSTFVGLAVN
jgi:hypothetical protein